MLKQSAEWILAALRLGEEDWGGRALERFGRTPQDKARDWIEGLVETAMALWGEPCGRLLLDNEKMIRMLATGGLGHLADDLERLWQADGEQVLDPAAARVLEMLRAGRESWDEFLLNTFALVPQEDVCAWIESFMESAMELWDQPCGKALLDNEKWVRMLAGYGLACLAGRLEQQWKADGTTYP